jgi:hypothetical protein
VAARAFRAFTALALILGLQAPAQAQTLELSVKAAFLPKFARYVQWPPAQLPAGSPLQLCIIGSDPFGSLIDQAAAGERVDQHPVAVRRLASTAQAAGCHIAFLRGTPAQSTASMLAALRPLPILTVTDFRSGAQRGMIHFALTGNRVGFHVDEAVAARSNLAISSRLLALA